LAAAQRLVDEGARVVITAAQWLCAGWRSGRLFPAGKAVGGDEAGGAAEQAGLRYRITGRCSKPAFPISRRAT
jgi:hypothetical protein